MSNSQMNEHFPLTPPLAPICDNRLIWEIWLSRLYLPTLSVANQIGLFPFLAQSPATVDEVAVGLSLGPRGVQAVVSLMSALGFLVQSEDRFHLTDEARTYLLPESPYYQGSILQAADSPMTTTTLREWLENDREGHHSEGLKGWMSGEISAEMAAPITSFMHTHSFPGAMGVARNGDFADVHQLLDVGGGSGCFCIALATRYPNMRFAVMELPAVCMQAEQYVARYGLQGQIETIAANMFTDPWPSGYDGVFFSDIFHNWDLAHCLLLAKRSFDMLPPGGRIFLHEMLLNDTKDGPPIAAAYSVIMLLTAGRQYTAQELGQLLQDVGFTDVAVNPTSAYFSLVCARKPIT
jgi:O-methyltransferase domain